MTQSESLRHDESAEGRGGDHRDSPCFMVRRDDSSRSVTEKGVERMQMARGGDPGASSEVVTEVPLTSGDALRLAIKLAVDAGEYERAAAVLDVLRRTTSV